MTLTSPLILKPKWLKDCFIIKGYLSPKPLKCDLFWQNNIKIKKEKKVNHSNGIKKHTLIFISCFP